MERIHDAPDDLWHALARTVSATMPRSRYARYADQLRQCVTSIDRYTQSDSLLLRTALHQLYATEGQVRMHALAAYSSLSLRQFERRFQRLTGMVPKRLARLIRFEVIRDRLLCHPVLRLLDLAYELGFTDQAHFVRDFKNIAA